MDDQVQVPAISIGRCLLTKCDLWVSEEFPANEIGVNTNISMADLSPTNDGKPTSYATLTTKVEYVDKDAAATKRASVSVELRAVVIADSAEQAIGPEAKRAACAMMYPQAQAYISMLAGSSPIAHTGIPMPDPDAVSRALAGITKTNE